MSDMRFPNETPEYRSARERLAEEEKALVAKMKAVAELRRQLPRGGKLKEDYTFEWANNGKVNAPVKVSELFGDKKTLIIYSMMYGPNWDKPCYSCTSLVDGFDRTAFQVKQDAAFVVAAKAPAEKLNAWANHRGWTHIDLLSAYGNSYLRDYNRQGETEDKVLPGFNVFQKRDGEIFHFWGSEIGSNFVDTVWPYWNLMDFTPEGRPDRPTPPQNFHSEFFEKNYLR